MNYFRNVGGEPALYLYVVRRAITILTDIFCPRFFITHRNLKACQATLHIASYYHE